MALLRFYAKDDMLVTVPGARPLTGQAPRYIGRKLELKDGVATYPSTGEAYECDSESEAGRRLLERIANEVRDGYGAPLTPADKATADACGLEFKAPSAPKAERKPARESEGA